MRKIILPLLVGMLLSSCGIIPRPVARDDDQGSMRGSIWSRANASIVSGMETRIDSSAEEVVHLNQMVNNAKWISYDKAVDLAKKSQDREVFKNSESTRWAEEYLRYRQEGNWLEAARMASAAIARVPSLAVAFALRAMAYVELGLAEEAVLDCRKALELEPDLIFVYNEMGRAYQRKKDLPRAIHYFRTACDFGNAQGCGNLEQIDDRNTVSNAGWTATLMEESVAAFQSGNYQAVEETTSKILQLEPENVSAFITRAGARALLQKYYPAIDDCHRALNLDPDNGIAYNNLGFVYEQMEDQIRAEVFYKKACNLGVTLGCSNLKMIQGKSGKKQDRKTPAEAKGTPPK